VEAVDLVLFKEVGDAIGIAFDAIALIGLHLGEIELGGDLDAHGREGVIGLVIGFRRM